MMELFLIYLWLQINTISFLFILAGVLFVVYVLLMFANYGDTYKRVSSLSKDQIKGLINETHLRNQKYFSFDYFEQIIEEASQVSITTFSIVKKWVYLSIFCVATGFLMPSKTDIAILVGASIAIDFAKSPEAEKVSILLRGKANELLDAEIKKLQPNK